MTHLYIELNTGLTEEVNSSIISKLYELAISGDLDNTSDLKGRLHSSTAKDVHVTYLNENFDDLYITVDKLYVTFTDPEVERVLMATGHIGDGLGISLSDCATYGNYDNYTVQFEIFKNNTTIEYFPEFKYFTYWINKGGQNWFNGCTNLKNIDITGCTNIVYSAFSGCSLSEFNTQQLSNVQTIGLFCFLNSGISGEINLPSLQNIYANAFFNCTGITKVSSLGSITELRNNTFSKCSNLTQVELPTTCTNIGNSVFSKCSSLSTINEEGTLAVTGALVLSHISTLGESAFAETGITSADFTGSTFTNVPDNMFLMCSNLTTVDIDWSKITSIGGGAFYRCPNISLSNISIPNLTSIGNGAFWNSGILSINNLGSITTIPSDAFNNCLQLTSLKIPNTVTSIYHNAFRGCKNLQETYDLSNVTYIELDSFLGCNKVVISNFPRITTYPGGCFYGIGNTSITIPKEVTTLENGVFWNCKDLTQITFESPCNVTTISIDLFNSCTSLLSVIIPEGITTVNRDCFSGCTSLLSIEFPSTVTTFSGRFAYNSLSLQSITIKATTPPQIDNNTLPGGNYTIYVPAASVSAYQSAWTNVASRIQAIPT